MLRHKDVTKLGKAVRHISRLRGGSGSALPGLVVEKLDPNFAARTLESLPHGVVIITGTNGKTTTTKIVRQLLESSGMKVFTNRTGSNFTRGIIAALLAEVDSTGSLDADIAVLELDEAYAAQFVKRVRPRYSLLLNVMRDQLDRFGENDHTANLLKAVARATTDIVVCNRDDELVRAIGEEIQASHQVEYYGVDSNLQDLFPSDQQLYSTKKSNRVTTSARVELAKVDGNTAWFAIDADKPARVDLKIKGVYNLQNAAAALCLVRTIVDIPNSTLVQSLSEVMPAFGRGEAVNIDGQPLELLLALKSYDHTGIETMIAINDNYADGRDMSWLWDVDFRMLPRVAYVSGIRAYDMALRLQYDEVEVSAVEPSIARALREFTHGPAKPRRIYCTYTAMMSIRKILQRQHNLESIDQ